MLKISEIFKDEVAEIRNVIESMKYDGCIGKYVNYISSGTSNLNDFESSFVKELNSRSTSFVGRLYEKAYSALSKDDLIKELVGLRRDGCCSLIDLCDDSIEEEITSLGTNFELYDDIKAELLDTLNYLIKKDNISKEGQRQNDIKRLEQSIEERTRQLNEYKERLDKLREEEIPLEEI